jgi:hypothetical protein
MMDKPRSTVYRRRSALAGILILLIASAGMYTWYSLSRSCQVDAVQDASAILVSQMNRYDNVYIPATAGTRTSLEYPLAVMQQILVDTEQVMVPACMRIAKGELIGYMGTVIRAFDAYRAGEPDATIQGLLDDSYGHIRAFRLELETVNECAPFCLPKVGK